MTQLLLLLLWVLLLVLGMLAVWPSFRATMAVMGGMAVEACSTAAAAPHFLNTVVTCVLL